MKMPVVLKVNGREYLLEVEPNELLLNVRRDRLRLTGARYGCGIGEYGACTVLLDGRAVPFLPDPGDECSRPGDYQHRRISTRGKRGASPPYYQRRKSGRGKNEREE